MTPKLPIIICGAGICGVSAAYFLAKSGSADVVLLDDRPPLTLTSDRSTECYRNWWPDPAILSLMNRSIELLEELARNSSNCFHMNRRGYLYVSGDTERVQSMSEGCARISASGGGPLRIHDKASSHYAASTADVFARLPDGADLLLGNQVIRTHFPYLTTDAIAALHVRRAGWLSAQQLGMHLLDQARSRGVSLRSGHVSEVETVAGEVHGVRLSNGERLECSAFVDAAGPYLSEVAGLLGVNLPVQTELHLKAAFKDPLGIVSREAPLLIWDDPQALPWDEEERELLDADPGARWLTELMPSGAHTRPEGPEDSQNILMLWDYRTRPMDPVFPVPLDDQYPEVVLRGLSTMLPGLRAYFGHAARPTVDGGYYVKTKENRLLACPLPVQGAYVLGAVSGYGIMAACGAGELLAAHVQGKKLPSYAPQFSLMRYDDPDYSRSLEGWSNSGQL